MSLAYFQRGTQYYVAGRFASLAHLIPANATLFHHAVELYLKGALMRQLSLEELRTIGHNLRRAWRSFKEVFPPDDLAHLDSSVSALHKFENIRYPEVVTLKGMRGNFSVSRADVVADPRQPDGAAPLPRFPLVLEDVDALVVAILARCGCNRSALLASLGEAAQCQLNERNRHPWRADA